MKANTQRLLGCPKHDFQPAPARHPGGRRRYVCTICQGSIDELAYEHFFLGGIP
jgi:hypothetical protein